MYSLRNPSFFNSCSIDCTASCLKSNLNLLQYYVIQIFTILSLAYTKSAKLKSQNTYTHTFWPKHLASIFNSYQFLLFIHHLPGFFPLLSFFGSFSAAKWVVLCLLPTEERDDLIYAGWCVTCHLREAAAAATIPSSYPKKLCRLLSLVVDIWGDFMRSVPFIFLHVYRHLALQKVADMSVCLCCKMIFC